MIDDKLNEDYFSNEDASNTDYFETVPVTTGKSPEKAGQISSAVALLNSGEIGPDFEQSADEIKNNLEVLGDDPVYRQVIEEQRADWKDALLKSGPRALIQSDEEASSVLNSINETLSTVDKLPEQPFLVSLGAEALLDDDAAPDFIFEDMMNRVMVESAAADMLGEAINKQEFELGDFVELLTVSPVTERQFRSKILDITGDNVAEWTFRAGDADKLVEWIVSGDDSKAIAERTRLLIEMVEREGDNGIFATDMLSQVRDQLLYVEDSAALDDALEAFVIADIKDILKGLKFLGAKALGTIAKRSGKVTDESVAAVKGAAQDVADTMAPRSQAMAKASELKVTPVASAIRRNLGSFGDQINLTNPRVMGALIKETSPEMLDATLSRVGMTPDEAMLRYFPNTGSEAGGMHSSYLTGATGATPVVSRFDNLTQEVVDQIENTARQSLYTPEEVLTGVQRTTDQFRKASNGSLQPQMVVVRPNVEGVGSISDLPMDSSFVKQFEKFDGAVAGATKAANKLKNRQATLKNKQKTKDLTDAEKAELDGLDARIGEANTELNTARSSRDSFLREANVKAISERGDAFDDIDFTFVMGQARDKGYRTLEDAEFSKSMLMGAKEGRILARPKNSGMMARPVEDFYEGGELPKGLEFFIEGRANYKYSPMDASAFGSDFFGAGIPLLPYVVPYSLRMNDNVWSSITALVGRNSAVAQQMVKLIKPMRALRGKKEIDATNNLLIHGTNNAMVFSRQRANLFLGGRINDRIWNAYKATRSYFDLMHKIRNDREYLSLNADGHKTLVDGTGRAIQDMKGAVFGRPIREAEMPTEGTLIDDLGNIVDVESTSYDKLIEEGATVVRTSRDITMNGDDYFEFMIVRSREGVQPLTMNPLPRNAGHVDIYYKGKDPLLKRLMGNANPGGNGYVIKAERSVTLNGKPATRDNTIAIVDTKDQADEFIRNSGDSTLKAIPSRERNSELGLSDSTDIMGLPSHSMGRGQRLQGPKGEAEILNPIEAVESSLGEVQSTLNRDMLDLLKSRFLAKYGQFMDPKKQSFPRNPEALTEALGSNAARYDSEAQELFKYIRMQENALTGRMNSFLMDSYNRLAESMTSKGSPGYNIIGSIMKGVPTRSTVALLAKTNQLFAIAARVIFQTLGNGLQSVTLLQRDPAVFFKTMAGTISVLAGTVVRKTKLEDSEKMMDILGFFMGLKGPDFKRFLDQMYESGIAETGMADDIFSLLLNGSKAEAGDLSTRSLSFWKQAPSRVAVRPLTLLPEYATKLNKVMAYVHAANINKRGNTTEWMFSNKGRDKIYSDADKLTFTQNRADQMAYQQNLLRITFQFMHHVHKMFLQTFLLPAYQSARGIGQLVRGDFNLNKKVSENIYSDTRAQALITFGMTMGLFGTRPIIGDENSASLEDKMKHLPSEVQVAVLDGLFNVGFEKMVNETFNISERFAALDFHTQFLNFLVTDDGGINLLGPTSMMYNNAVKVKSWVLNNHDNPAMSSERFWDGVEYRVLNMFSGYRDWEKANIVRNLGEYKLSNGMTVQEADPKAYAAIMASLAPTATIEYFANQDYIKGQEEFVNKVVNDVLAEFHRWSRDNPEATPDEVDEQIDLMYKWLVAPIGQDNIELVDTAKRELAKRLTGDAGAPASQRQLRKLIQFSENSTQARRRIERILNDNPELREDPVIQMYMEIYKEQEENN